MSQLAAKSGNDVRLASRLRVSQPVRLDDRSRTDESYYGLTMTPMIFPGGGGSLQPWSAHAIGVASYFFSDVSGFNGGFDIHESPPRSGVTV